MGCVTIVIHEHVCPAERRSSRTEGHTLATRATTEAKIFNGALRALARQGPKKLAMSDIAAEAGVSGGTLYRYFKNKEDLLQALGDHYVMRLRGILQGAIAEQPDPADRLRVVIDIMLRYWQENPATVQLGQLEPGFVIAYIKQVSPQLSAVIHDAVEPALADSPAVRLGLATADEIVDLIVRMAFSHYFMPADDYRELRDLLVALGTSAGLEPKKARTRTGRKAAS
ncbi:MAG: TetR/AcrR family transcriptional regulator [Mycobacterium sp.]